MRLIFITFSILLYSITVSAQNYDADYIPKELLPYASAVIRNSEETIEVKNLDDVVYHIKQAITVLNKNGDDLAHIVIEHDKNNAIKYIKGVVYNQYGKQIGKFSESDFDDVNAGHDFSLYEDVRIKHYLPSITDYPYTIAYEYEERSNQSLNFDSWKPNPYIGLSVEKSSFTFICKPDFIIRYKEINLPGKVNISNNLKGLKTYTWQINNIKAIKYEPYSPYPDKSSASVQIAPEKFTYYGKSGSFTNWNELGKWEYDNLIADRQLLPAETIAHIKEITKDISDPKLKAKKVYEYMQNKTHYISVQVGIGGNQPFLASDVDRLNYGDCKALVNYTQALLKAINIESYYCVVEANSDYKIGLQNDFASMEQGNHIILCLPFKNDTTWADCTSQTIPFGYLGDFTDDRNVLACTPAGGKLMHTPKYTVNNNSESRKAIFLINADGELSGSMNTLFKGVDYELRDELVNESRTEQDKMLQKIYPINNLYIDKLGINQNKSFDPTTTETIKLHANNYASYTDGKYYFLINPVNRIDEPPKQVRNRLNDVYFSRGHTNEDEVIYTIPAGYHLEKDPLNINLDKPFAKFSVTMVLTGNQLVYKRKIQFINGTYSKDSYADLIDFYQAVVDADGYEAVLVKNN